MKKNHFFRREVTNTALSELALLKRWLILIFFFHCSYCCHCHGYVTVTEQYTIFRGNCKCPQFLEILETRPDPGVTVPTICEKW